LKILNILNLNQGDLETILKFCEDRVKKQAGAFLIPINPIKVVKARKFADFQNIINRADWVFPDARGIKFAASFLYGVSIPVVPGYKVFFALIEQARNLGESVYLLGTTENNLRKAVARLEESHPGLRIAGWKNGYFSDDEGEEIRRQVAKLRPKYVFVAMGEYKQEKMIDFLKKGYPNAIYQGIGGSLDLVAGSQPIPPDWIRKHHLEWLYRLYRQPFRLPRFKALPIFVLLTIVEKVRLIINSERL
jgi:N-acetylglucosaminyldiphosphoundecaprenol N-acetyl-beta-D-mannosaminyltransferase